MVILQRETREPERALGRYYVERKKTRMDDAVRAQDLLFVLSGRYRRSKTRGIDKKKRKILREIKEKYGIPDIKKLDTSPNLYAKLNDKLRSLTGTWTFGSTPLRGPVFRVERGMYKVDHKRTGELQRKAWDIMAIRMSSRKGSQEEMDLEGPEDHRFRHPTAAFCTIYSCPSLTDREKDRVREHLRGITDLLENKSTRPIIVVNMRAFIPKKWWEDWESGILNPDTYDPDMDERGVRIRKSVWGSSEKRGKRRRSEKKED